MEELVQRMLNNLNTTTDKMGLIEKISWQVIGSFFYGSLIIFIGEDFGLPHKAAYLIYLSILMIAIYFIVKEKSFRVKFYTEETYINFISVILLMLLGLFLFINITASVWLANNKQLFMSDNALGQIIILLLLSLVTLRYLNIKFMEYLSKKINIKSIIINISTIMLIWYFVMGTILFDKIVLKL